ncbi:MAG: acyltransferase family protein, partial [Acidobacteria bacterium]|nr:acyltransferase family protein [Acidobacteriota bacterium]
MTETPGPVAVPKRIYFLDNLRTGMIFLVVLLHAGIVYESSGVGAYFWIVDDPQTNDASGLLNLILDIFVMPAIIFVSGYFIPGSLAKSGTAGFVTSKLRRLMIPWLLGVVTLIPLYKVIFLASRGLPQEPWVTYFPFSNGIISQSWLWFLPILFLFDLAYLGLSKTGLSFESLSLRAALPVATLVAFAASLALDLLGHQGWTKTALLDFQNERL